MFPQLITSTLAAPPPAQPERLMRLWEICRIPAVTEEKAAANRACRELARKAGSKKYAGRVVRPRPACEGLLPISPATWWAGVKSGRYPQPVRLGPRTVAWKASDVQALVEKGV